MPTPETRRQLLTAVAACDDKKGEDTRILELDPADSGLADFFLITSATNDRQVVAIADEIEFRLKKDYGLYAASVEGRRQGEWILLDYVDIVIHVFLAEKRAFYDIERLRKSARPLTGPELEAAIETELKVRLAKKTLDVRSHAPQKAASKKSIPTPKKKASIPTRNAASSKKSPTPVTEKKSAKGDSSVSPSPTKKAAKKAPAKAAKKAAKAPLKAAAKKAPVKAAKKAAKAPAKKAPVKATVKKAALKKAAVKKAAPKKLAVKKVAVKKVAAKKSAPIKATVKKAAKKKVVAPPAPPPPPTEGVVAPVGDLTGPDHGVIGQGAKPPIIK